MNGQVHSSNNSSNTNNKTAMGITNRMASILVDKIVTTRIHATRIIHSIAPMARAAVAVVPEEDTALPTHRTISGNQRKKDTGKAMEDTGTLIVAKKGVGLQMMICGSVAEGITMEHSTTQTGGSYERTIPRVRDTKRRIRYEFDTSIV